MLSRCTLLMTMIFNRRRPAEVESLLIEKYTQNYDPVKKEEFALTALEKILTGRFKWVVSGGKGTKSVPLLFSKKMQRYIDIMLDIPTSFKLVPTENEYVFAEVGAPKNCMNGYSILQNFPKNVASKGQTY